MFDSLRKKIGLSLRKLMGQDKLTASNIKTALLEVREALLSADVPAPVAEQLLHRIERSALGKEIVKGVDAGQFFIKVVNDELTKLLSADNNELNLRVQPPAVIMLVGLQGAGKTTTAVKLATWIKQQLKKRAMVVSCDLTRPAAREQLAILAESADITCFNQALDAPKTPLTLANKALEAAKQQLFDVLIIDTAGRLYIQPELMAQLQQITGAVNPVETLLVVDSMIGQESLGVAQGFSKDLKLTGVILTKIDSDTRGGAAIAMRQVTGCPIKFIGVSEKVVGGLESFKPDRIASRILGMGDVLSLVEQAIEQINQQEAARLQQKMLGGGTLNLNDLRTYLNQIDKLGGMASILERLPMMGVSVNKTQIAGSEQQLKQMRVVIDSMTKKERCFPAHIRTSQKERIAKGSGTSVTAVNEVLRYHQQLQKQMGHFSTNKLNKLMSRLPPNLLNQFLH